MRSMRDGLVFRNRGPSCSMSAMELSNVASRGSHHEAALQQGPFKLLATVFSRHRALHQLFEGGENLRRARLPVKVIYRQRKITQRNNCNKVSRERLHS
jgi:hypothetical protein